MRDGHGTCIDLITRSSNGAVLATAVESPLERPRESARQRGGQESKVQRIRPQNAIWEIRSCGVQLVCSDQR